MKFNYIVVASAMVFTLSVASAAEVDCYDYSADGKPCSSSVVSWQEGEFRQWGASLTRGTEGIISILRTNDNTVGFSKTLANTTTGNKYWTWGGNAPRSGNFVVRGNMTKKYNSNSFMLVTLQK